MNTMNTVSISATLTGSVFLLFPVLFRSLRFKKSQILILMPFIERLLMICVVCGFILMQAFVLFADLWDRNVFRKFSDHISFVWLSTTCLVAMTSIFSFTGRVYFRAMSFLSIVFIMCGEFNIMVEIIFSDYIYLMDLIMLGILLITTWSVAYIPKCFHITKDMCEVTWSGYIPYLTPNTVSGSDKTISNSDKIVSDSDKTV